MQGGVILQCQGSFTGRWHHINFNSVFLLQVKNYHDSEKEQQSQKKNHVIRQLTLGFDLHSLVHSAKAKIREGRHTRPQKTVSNTPKNIAAKHPKHTAAYLSDGICWLPNVNSLNV